MLVLNLFIYPAVLVGLLAGAGLLVDRASAGLVPAPLLLSVGAALLIGATQLVAYIPAIAPASPYALLALAAAGFVIGRRRAVAIARRVSAQPLSLAVPVLAYLFAVAPVLLAGRASFSAYLTVSDAAVHMIGADYLIRHGMDFSHLDLSNSYGQTINAYYNMHYPSGADTLFGASARLISLPLIWAFQPFNGVIFALATGPAWLLARRMGLRGLLAGTAALSVTIPALVYGFVLMSSVKEITALTMILSLAALCVQHRRWLNGPPRSVIPFALLLAAGFSALGAAFGAWALPAIVVLVLVVAGELRAGRLAWRQLAVLVGIGAAVTIVAAWPTWAGVSGSVQVAQNIASTTNRGNLTSTLHPALVFGIWLWGTYQEAPAGSDLVWTQALIILTVIAVLIGLVHLARIRALTLLGWLALMLLVWLIVSDYVTAWAGAKTLMLTSPVLVLLAWGGVAGLRASPLRVLAPVLALALVAAVLVSDAYQYNSTELAPTARYEELGSLDARYAGDGPAIFADFDEYSLYQLRDLDIAGPDFRYRPTDLPNIAMGHGHSVDLERAPPSELLAYPLIITRRDPLAPRPPSAYTMVWQGHYYQVWRRRNGAPAALAVLTTTHGVEPSCPAVGAIARRAPAGSRLVAALAPRSIRIRLELSAAPAGWQFQQNGLSMAAPGTLRAPFSVPAPGIWELWLQGQLMGTVAVGIDGTQITRISGQVGGDAAVPDIAGPFHTRLTAGEHTLTGRRIHRPLAPGDGGLAVLSGAFLVPAGPAGEPSLLSVAPAQWRSLCRRALQWIELVPA
jgi:hypothetical protein